MSSCLNILTPEACKQAAESLPLTLAIAPLLLFAIAFAVLIVSYVIQSMLIKRPNIKPAALEDWDFPQSDEGTPETVFFGDGWATGPMVIWYGNYRTKKIKSSGGKK